MKILIFALCFALQATALLAQNTESTLNDEEMENTLQQIKDNIDDLYNTFKTESQPDADINMDDSYVANIKLYNIPGYTYTTDFDNSISFSVGSDDFPEATRDDFEQAFETISENLKTIFDDLEIKQKNLEKQKVLTLFEMGKNTEVPIINPDSPRYYISLKLTEDEGEDHKSSWSLFLYIMSKK